MTYAQLNLLVLAVVVTAGVVLAGPARRDPRWWSCVAAVAVLLCTLTVVFDSIMIRADLFRFDESLLIGVELGSAPVEDLAWPLAAAVFLPALWTRLGRRDRTGVGS